MAEQTCSWINEVTESNIEAGDAVTLTTESGYDQFDGEAKLRAASEPTSNGWLEFENPGEGDIAAVPDSDSEAGAVLVQGHIRSTGHIASRRDLAEVHGVKSVNKE